jgi:hypothetical protein
MNWWDFINQYRAGLVVLLCILALLFICFGHVYREQVQLALKREFFKFPECSLDWWSVSHFCLFALFGFLIPEYPLTFFALGMGFELVEDGLSSDQTTQLANCANSAVKATNPMCWCSINNDYWYMNPSDPWVNLTGYIVGSAIRTTLL